VVTLTPWATSTTEAAAGRWARRASPGFSRHCGTGRAAGLKLFAHPSPDFSRHCGAGRAVGLKLFAHPSVQTEVWTGRATSQHLAALRRIGLVKSRREGTSIFYRVADQEVFNLLEAGRELVIHAVEEQRALLAEIKDG
jgi:hypothetical protein